MSSTVLIKNYSNIPINRMEVLRYAGGSAETTEKLLNNCIAEAKNRLNYRVCYVKFNLEINENVCNFGVIKIKSNDLSRCLKGCKKVVIFAATTGIDIDRLIAKYSRISPAKALVFQALGTERIETLCDAFCKDLKEQNSDLTPRFSPGYGDLPLEIQTDIFNILSCEKNIGLTLNDSLLMSPIKSVTAIVGIR